MGFKLSDPFGPSPGMMPNRLFCVSFLNYDVSSMSSWKFGYIGIGFFFTYEVMIKAFFNIWLNKYPVWVYSNDRKTAIY